ncbi:MAG: hypothetical protein ABH875_02935, partial [Candidatus Omnitrophota bacterium]
MPVKIFLIVCLSLLCARSSIYADDTMDRIRAVESLMFFVESRFPHVLTRSRDIEIGIPYGLSEPLDLKLISDTVNSLLTQDLLPKGRLWLHRSYRKTSERWSRFSHILPNESIVFYDSVEDILDRFDPAEDVAIFRTRDLEALAISGTDRFEDAVILSPIEIRLEYMDLIAISLILVKELRDMIAIDGIDTAKKSAEFMTLKVLFGLLTADRAGLNDIDLLAIIPHPAWPFARRALTILQRSMNPIRREELEDIRKVQSSFKSV